MVSSRHNDGGLPDEVKPSGGGGSGKTPSGRKPLKPPEAPPGFEPGIEDLQSSALPLGHGADRTTKGSKRNFPATSYNTVGAATAGFAPSGPVPGVILGPLAGRVGGMIRWRLLLLLGSRPPDLPGRCRYDAPTELLGILVVYVGLEGAARRIPVHGNEPESLRDRSRGLVRYASIGPQLRSKAVPVARELQEPQHGPSAPERDNGCWGGIHVQHTVDRGIRKIPYMRRSAAGVHPCDA
jgi:hypothetical protein